MNQRRAEAVTIGILVAAISAAHYLTPPDWPLMHDLYRRLYYVPIVWAGIRFGLSGGLLTSIVVSCVFLPHIFHSWGKIDLQTTDAIFEILLYNSMAWVTGVLAGSERKSRDQLEQAQVELIRSNQMKRLGEIAAGMAHEIRNPLASLRGGIELLGKDSTPPPVREEVSGILLPEMERIERVIQDFLLYARPSEPMKQLTDVAEIAAGVLALLKQSNPAGVEMNLSAAPGPMLVNGDQMMLRTLILNLALNAVQAVNGNMKDSGQPDAGQPSPADEEQWHRFSTCVPPSGTVDIILTRDRGNVILKVKDNGPGIDPEAVDLIFEPFHTTRPDGLGLGLSLVKRIVEEHGGKIRLESEPGRGAEFIVSLPGASA